MIVLPKAPSFRLDGKRALVTGAGRGIGLGLAAALAQAGAHVTLCARSADEIESVASAVRNSDGSAEALVLDVSDIASVRRVLATREADDILVNNAGTNRPKPFDKVTEEDYDAVLDLNLKANFFVAQTVATKMIHDGRRGSIIQISSQMGHVGAQNRALYCASKWGLEGLTRAMALDLAPHGIRVNTIAPTFIETPMTKPFLDDPGFLVQTLGKIKLGRLGKVEDLMGAVLFLASDASSLMTGSSLMIDGGWTAE